MISTSQLPPGDGEHGTPLGCMTYLGFSAILKYEERIYGKYNYGILNKTGLPWWLNSKESAFQCRRCGFNPWVRKIPWRREWPPTQVFLPGKSHGQRSLVGYLPEVAKESDTTEWLKNDRKAGATGRQVKTLETKLHKVLLTYWFGPDLFFTSCRCSTVSGGNSSEQAEPQFLPSWSYSSAGRLTLKKHSQRSVSVDSVFAERN